MNFERTLQILILSLTVLSGGTSTAQSQANRPVRLKVMSYNIHHANPPERTDGFIDLPAIARVIRSSDPDLVALQEVDVNTIRSGKGVHQARELAALTGMHFFFAKAIDHEGGDYGVAVLSKFPPVDSLRLPLPLPENVKGEPRTLAAVAIEPRKGDRIWFGSTHLDLTEATRLFQCELILKNLATKTDPVILAGDFNAVPESRELSRLSSAFTRTCNEDCPPTIPVIRPRKTIDFILYTQEKRIKTLKHQVISETYASDHLPVVAELSFD
ncbi:endonuclease/exonuclease/phosphatase family protein [Ravibacter arvi]|uniref:Endonuclease/exonuclease/phosphatase family protein n=1 Tax=Ravibacter arvi TaxID=2051041 RepID=A0ABP8LUV6_9BACT